MNLCNIFGKLQYCINKDCMNNDDFKKVPIYGGNSASDYVGNYYGFDYMCNGDGNLRRLPYSYDCLKNKALIIGKDCDNFPTDCKGRKNENICFVTDAKAKCGSEANIYTNNSLSTVLCHSHPECCSNGSNIIKLSMGFLFILYVIQAASSFTINDL
uniref:Uncharacterized protein n=1 Tax=Panagrolaimus sp. ES5 TaxID=591445 RepID=A0AC34F9V9_9BILA